MSTSTVKDTINGILIQIHNSGSCPDTVAFCQATNYFANYFLTGMQTEENRVTPLRKSGLTSSTTQQLGIIGTVNFIADNVILPLFPEVRTCFIRTKKFQQFI